MSITTHTGNSVLNPSIVLDPSKIRTMRIGGLLELARQQPIKRNPKEDRTK